MSKLIAHIQKLNAEAKAKQEANPGSIYGLLSEDEAWWADRNVTTVAQYERWGYECVMSDLAKEAYGTRSMCPDTASMSLEELKAEHDRLCEIADENFNEEQRFQAKAVAEFEASVTNLINSGAGDRETAIRWLRDSDEGVRDNNYLEYCNNSHMVTSMDNVQDGQRNVKQFNNKATGRN